MIDITSSISSRCDIDEPSRRSRAAIIIASQSSSPLAAAASGASAVTDASRRAMTLSMCLPSWRKRNAKAQIAGGLLGQHGEWIGAKFGEQAIEIGAEVARSTTSSALSLVSRVTFSISPLAAFSAQLASRRRFAIGDQFAEPLDARALKHRLHQPMLALPDFAFADDDAVADQNPDAIQAHADV